MKYIKHTSDDGEVNLFFLIDVNDVNDVNDCRKFYERPNENECLLLQKKLDKLYDLTWYASTYKGIPKYFTFNNQDDMWYFELSNYMKFRFSLVEDWKKLVYLV